MPRASKIGYFASRGAYYTKIKGVQYKLADGPDDEATNGPTFQAASKEFLRLLEKDNLDAAGEENTVRTLFNAYLDACAGTVAEKTLANKKAALTAFVDKYGGLKAKDVKPRHAREVIDERRKGRTVSKQFGRGNVTQRRFKWGNGQERLFIAQLKAAFNWAVEQDLIPRNPVGGKRLKAPPERTRTRDRVVTPEDHAAVLQHLRNPRSKSVRRIVVALENTGARPGELTNARVRHFFPDIGALIHFADEKRRPGDFRHKLAGKGKDRVIYFTGEGLDLVKELCAEI